MLQLPDFAYDGDHPDGFLQKDEIVQYLEDFAARFDPPVRTGIEVSAVKDKDFGKKGRFSLETSAGLMIAFNVVVAAGTFQKPRIPEFSSRLAFRFYQIHSSEYTSPGELPPGAVLTVGSGQSGCQIADELSRHGRQVYLCTGNADWLPRRYRGKDSFWWAKKLGIFDQTVEDLPSPEARFKANPQNWAAADFKKRCWQAGCSSGYQNEKKKRREGIPMSTGQKIENFEYENTRSGLGKAQTTSASVYQSGKAVKPG